MKLKNYEIENFLNILTDKTSFRFDMKVKQPPEVRFAIRKNVDSLVDVYKTYEETRKEIIQNIIDDGHGKRSDDGSQIVVDPDFIPIVNKELLELANIETEVDIMCVSQVAMDDFLKTVNISTPEEDVLLKFVKEG